MAKKVDKELVIRQLVKSFVLSYSAGFSTRHINEADDPEGTINSKIHNVFIAALGPDIQYYSSLVRSLDSSLGNMLEKLAISIAELSYDVHREVVGPLSVEQTRFIAELLEKYKRRELTPSVADYQWLRTTNKKDEDVNKRHDSDYYLIDNDNDNRYLIELKIGGDLDNKKARSEKEALLEQFTILSNTLGKNEKISIHFATAYNRYGEDKPWRQERVKQFFADDELMIGRDFWNFVTKMDNGYEVVISEYRKNAHVLREALDEIKATYLGQEQ
ncbi:MAG: TdeIII family type II restriction endonuclease [Micrococcaceae bacterium]